MALHRLFAAPVMVAVVAVTGCASTPELDSREALPAWTAKSQFVDAATTHHVFVGMGQAATEPEAKRRAASDAQAQYVRAVGGIVTTSQRVRESGETDSTGISSTVVTSERYTGSSSSALLHNTETEYVVTRGDYGSEAYARMSVPAAVLSEAREAVRREHQQTINRKKEAYKLSRESRVGGASDTFYAFVVERASASSAPGAADIVTERAARQNARHNAKVSAAEKIHGLNVQTAAIQSGSRSAWSNTTSTGTVRTEVIAERVWWEGNTAVAESYVLCWADQE